MGSYFGLNKTRLLSKWMGRETIPGYRFTSRIWSTKLLTPPRKNSSTTHVQSLTTQTYFDTESAVYVMDIPVSMTIDKVAKTWANESVIYHVKLSHWSPWSTLVLLRSWSVLWGSFFKIPFARKAFIDAFILHLVQFTMRYNTHYLLVTCSESLMSSLVGNLMLMMMTRLWEEIVPHITHVKPQFNLRVVLMFCSSLWLQLTVLNISQNGWTRHPIVLWFCSWTVFLHYCSYKAICHFYSAENCLEPTGQSSWVMCYAEVA